MTKKIDVPKKDQILSIKNFNIPLDLYEAFSPPKITSSISKHGNSLLSGLFVILPA
jgi:hypothetical protein